MMSLLYFHSIIKKRINHIFSSEFLLVFFYVQNILPGSTNQRNCTINGYDVHRYFLKASLVSTLSGMMQA